MNDAPIPLIVGPTASGKTARAVALALETDAEILSADSRQVYRRLDIGTAKPTAEERAAVPHHFVDEMELGEPFTAGVFAQAAEDRIAEIRGRGRPAIVVGGSTLYVAALRDGLAAVPAVPPQVRAALNARLEAEGLDALVASLQRVDPEIAARLDLRNPRRVLRALEVFEATGQPLSAFQNAPRVPPRYRYAVTFLSPDPADLARRIDARTDVMMAAGWLGEVATLLADGFAPTLAPLRTIGYRELVVHLGGRLGLPETVALIKRNTRHYARRQLTYFTKFGLQ